MICSFSNPLLCHRLGRQHQIHAVQIEAVLAQGFVLHLGIPLQLAVGCLGLQQVVEFGRKKMSISGTPAMRKVRRLVWGSKRLVRCRLRSMSCSGTMISWCRLSARAVG